MTPNMETLAYVYDLNNSKLYIWIELSNIVSFLQVKLIGEKHRVEETFQDSLSVAIIKKKKGIEQASYIKLSQS